jgi:hypothetical protein
MQNNTLFDFSQTEITIEFESFNWEALIMKQSIIQLLTIKRLVSFLLFGVVIFLSLGGLQLWVWWGPKSKRSESSTLETQKASRKEYLLRDGMFIIG